MSPSLFLVCLFLIAACTEGAVIDKEKGMNDTALLELVHHTSKRHNIPLERRQTSTCTLPDLPSGCDPLYFIFSVPEVKRVNESQLSNFNDQYSRMCTSDCAGALAMYYRCSEEDTGEYLANYIEKYLCGQESGDYCPVRLIRSLNTTSNAVAYNNMMDDCPIPFSSTGLTCSNTNCINGLKNFTSIAGCCTEPFLGSGVSSCSGVSVPDACTGVSSATGSSTTGSSAIGSCTTGSSALGIIVTLIVATTCTGVSSATGSSATGSSATGSSATGSSATGSSATGSSATGSSATGSSATGSSATGSSTTGSSATGSCTIGPSASTIVSSGTGIIATLIVATTCTGVDASSTTESSATGIIATPIVGVSLMILALAGVFL